MVVSRLLFSALIVLLGLSVRAETSVDASAYSSKNLLSDLTSPWTTRADRIFYSGAGLTLISLAIESTTDNQFQKDTARSRILGESAKFGDLMGQLVPNAVYSLGMLATYFIATDEVIKQKSINRSFFMLETTLYASALSAVLKYSVREPRPNASDRYSFPSGHSTTIFSFAGVVGLEHEWYCAVPAYALAAFVGFSRINDNMHYAHDVLGGATIGLSYAFGIWYNRHRTESRNDAGANADVASSSLFILPTDDLSGSIASWRRHF